MYVCASSFTLVHPAKAAGRKEMPLGRDTRVVPSNIVGLLDRGPIPTGREDLGSVPQIAAMPPIAELL